MKIRNNFGNNEYCIFGNNKKHNNNFLKEIWNRIMMKILSIIPTSLQLGYVYMVVLGEECIREKCIREFIGEECQLFLGCTTLPCVLISHMQCSMKIRSSVAIVYQHKTH